MAESTPVLTENSDSGQHLVTRRRLLKQAGAAGIALTAMYVAPSFSSFGPKKAYATTVDTSCDLCAGKRKPAKLTMEYTGLANAGTNSQDLSKVNVVGSPGGADPVYIVASDHSRDKWVETFHVGHGHFHAAHDHRWMFFIGSVEKGADFAIDAAAAVKVDDATKVLTKLKSKTFVYIFANAADAADPSSTPLQSIEFHTSCSQPLFKGDGFGTLILKEFIDENGDKGCLDGDRSTEPTGCFGVGKTHIETMTLKYTGDDASFTAGDHDQPADKSGAVDSNGGPAGSAPVWIISSDKEDLSGHIWFDGQVDSVGDTFVINPQIPDPTSELKANTWFKIYEVLGGGPGTLLQTVQMHTSCSQPLSVGDKFGAIEVTNGFVLV